MGIRACVVVGWAVAGGCLPCPDGSRTLPGIACPVPDPDPAQTACNLAPEAFLARDGGVALVVELGTGSDAFEALPDGGDVTLAHGAQGGTHIWTSVRVVEGGADRASVRLVNRTRVADGGFEVAAWDTVPFTRCVGLTPASGSPQQRVGLTNFYSGPPGSVVAVELDVAVPDGRVGRDVRMVTVR
jgi:hypothetical protein